MIVQLNIDSCTCAYTKLILQQPYALAFHGAVCVCVYVSVCVQQVSFALLVISGTVGYIGTSLFVRKIYATVKIDWTLANDVIGNNCCYFAHILVNFWAISLPLDMINVVYNTHYTYMCLYNFIAAVIMIKWLQRFSHSSECIIQRHVWRSAIAL